jgi:hypothetical protein
VAKTIADRIREVACRSLDLNSAELSKCAQQLYSLAREIEDEEVAGEVKRKYRFRVDENKKLVLQLYTKGFWGVPHAIEQIGWRDATVQDLTEFDNIKEITMS